MSSSAAPGARFDDLFRQCYPRLFGLAARVLGDPSEADDLVQEAFIRLARTTQPAPCAADGGAAASLSGLGADLDAEPDAGARSGSLLDRPDEEVAAWLRRVVLNLGMNRLRDSRRARERIERAGRLDPELGDDLAADERDNPARTILRREAREEVQTALASLPERQRSCLLLRHAGYSYAEIAATLGIAIGSVGVYLARGERAFRDIYQEHHDEHDLP
ncbi:MAG: sigma-70 family RNA polymerase sigma factor [Chloroflexi bacterium]|nr:sigma-70 family RNA polymerase sigma factor [Chloroflexota bacterium]